MDWIGVGQKSYVSKFLQPFLFAQSFTGIPYCIAMGDPGWTGGRAGIIIIIIIIIIINEIIERGV